MNQIVVRRSVQSASCQTTTVRSQRAGVRRTVNAWPTWLRNSSTLLRIQTARAMRPKTTITSTICETCGWSRNQAKSKLGSDGSTSKLGNTPWRHRPGEEGDRAGRVDDREHEARADERRVRGSLDGPVRHRQPDDVAGAGGKDRVDADACDVGRVDRRPADPLLGVGGREHVAPRPTRAHRLREVAADRDRERQRPHRGQVVPESGNRVEDLRTRSPYPVAAEGNHDRDAVPRPAGDGRANLRAAFYAACAARPRRAARRRTRPRRSGATRRARARAVARRSDAAGRRSRACRARTAPFRARRCGDRRSARARGRG